MKLIDELKKRSNSVLENDNIKIDLKLYNLAHDLVEKVKPHLKRIIAILPEFDIHDERHSEKVILNMEHLLGDKIHELSSYEIFLLYLSAFLHDSAMAPSDYEINVMKLTEGIGNFFENKNSIKNDTKSPLKFSEAVKLIKELKQNIYITFNFRESWIFCTDTEEGFIKYLAELLIDYQNHRNGFSKDLKKIDSIENFKELNDFIRVDYIRATHHSRAEQYIKNLEREFSNKIGQTAWGKKLAHDLGKICRAHGENIKFIESFERSTRYYEAPTTNLQMVAMILRLSDIIHYSFDRAPISLLSSKIFKSEYSFHEWMVKQSGANYTIENGLISYSAYCTNPNEYFKLHKYIDWIDNEIQNYFKFQRVWGKEYIKNLAEKVNREGIDSDTSKFLPKRGVGFSLNQRKILELLKGIGLYKDEYACLRELYQNSLDACRCMITKISSDDVKAYGKIEFGIDESDLGTYLYCLDNGIGMTKEIIENYLLNVGNSYYNSFEFYREQAKWGGDFTPTSQFGIGILSCFMIGNKIEIITKTETSIVCCVINGIDDSFYYKSVEPIDEEKIKHTGTFIKIYLNADIAENIENSNIDKWGIVMLDRHYMEGFEKYENEINLWNNHIVKYISSFINEIPENIDIKIKLKDGNFKTIVSKPTYILQHKEDLNINLNDDRVALENLILGYDVNESDEIPSIHEIDQNINIYKIEICEKEIKFSDLFFLPNKEFNFTFEKWTIDRLVINNNSNTVSIDGIAIESNSLYRNNYDENYFLAILNDSGSINFTGELRPTISIDRKSVISYPEECDNIAQTILKKYFEKISDIAIEHIISNDLFNDDLKIENLCCNTMTKLQLEYGDTLFIQKLYESEIGKYKLKSIFEITGENFSIVDFIDAEKFKLKNLDYKNYNYFIKSLVDKKLKESLNIIVKDSFIEIITKQNKIDIKNLLEVNFEITQHLYEVDLWKPFNDEFDIITGLFPFIPSKLFNQLNLLSLEFNSKIKILPPKYSTINNVFFQSAISINSKIGMYHPSEIDNSTIYNFTLKIDNLFFDEIVENTESKKIVIMAFISPEHLNTSDIQLLNHYKTIDPDYAKGVSEGWSILFTSIEKHNYVISPGKTSREELIQLFPKEFWEENDNIEFSFTDGSPMKKKN